MNIKTTTIQTAGGAIRTTVDELAGRAGHEVRARGCRVANELQNQVNNVLRGERHGQRYIIPGTGTVRYKKGKRVVVGREADNYGRKGRKIYRREAGTATITYKRYTASAPGEPPANRTGAFRLSWHRKSYAAPVGGHDVDVHGVTESSLRVNGRLLGELLDEGTERMAPRPYRERVIEKAMPKVRQIYHEPYFRG